MEHRWAHRREREAERQSAVVARRLEDRKAKLLVALERHYYLLPAAEAVGVDPRTAYRWAAGDAVFAAAMETSRRIASDRFETGVLAAAGEMNMTAVRCAEAVVRRVDANESRRRRAAEDQARRRDERVELPEPDCDAALAWAQRPRLEAV